MTSKASNFGFGSLLIIVTVAISFLSGCAATFQGARGRVWWTTSNIPASRAIVHLYDQRVTTDFVGDLYVNSSGPTGEDGVYVINPPLCILGSGEPNPRPPCLGDPQFYLQGDPFMRVTYEPSGEEVFWDNYVDNAQYIEKDFYIETPFERTLSHTITVHGEIRVFGAGSVSPIVRLVTSSNDEWYIVGPLAYELSFIPNAKVEIVGTTQGRDLTPSFYTVLNFGAGCDRPIKGNLTNNGYNEIVGCAEVEQYTGRCLEYISQVTWGDFYVTNGLDRLLIVADNDWQLLSLKNQFQNNKNIKILLCGRIAFPRPEFICSLLNILGHGDPYCRKIHIRPYWFGFIETSSGQ